MPASRNAPDGEKLETAKLKLVTIIAPYGLGDIVAKELRALGVPGYTRTAADGWGRHGVRHAGIVENANVRVELLLNAQLAEDVLRRVVDGFGDDAVVAFVRDVEAVPRNHFV